MAEKQTKYIFVTGGVVSGLGKGITTASLGRGYFKFSVLFFSSSISSCLISAVSEKRMRDVPSGTVGGRTGRA